MAARDQKSLKRRRIGYYGVIDECRDYELIAAGARLRPDYQWIFVGPLAKIDPADLPQVANLHYLGSKKYEALPQYLAGWDVAMMPFALNEATTYSALPIRRSILQVASRSFQPPSPTSSKRTVTAAWSASRPMPKPL